MVYCSKCGTQNPDDAITCSNCGAPLRATTGQGPYGPYWRHRRYESQYRHYRGGSGIGALVFGVIMVLFGLSFLLSQVYGFTFPWWPVVLILIGVWLLFIGLRRSRRNQPQGQ